MRDSVRNGTRLRCHVWNEGRDGVGFWCLVSLHPVMNNETDGEIKLKYICALQLRLTCDQLQQAPAAPRHVTPWPQSHDPA